MCRRPERWHRNCDLRRVSMEGIVREFVKIIASLFPVSAKEGVTAIEYGLIAALVAVAIIAAVTLLGTNLSTTFNTIAGHLGANPQ
jgi:pilus assembly protein Flp/PilA